jgi:hypothetical protein
VPTLSVGPAAAALVIANSAPKIFFITSISLWAGSLRPKERVTGNQGMS